MMKLLTYRKFIFSGSIRCSLTAFPQFNFKKMCNDFYYSKCTCEKIILKGRNNNNC